MSAPTVLQELERMFRLGVFHGVRPRLRNPNGPLRDGVTAEDAVALALDWLRAHEPAAHGRVVKALSPGRLAALVGLELRSAPRIYVTDADGVDRESASFVLGPAQRWVFARHAPPRERDEAVS
jgi:hypothetical protein